MDIDHRYSLEQQLAAAIHLSPDHPLYLKLLPEDADDQSDDAAPEQRMDAAAAFSRAVEHQAYDLRVREAARVKVATERAGETPPFDAGLLTEVLARPAEPPHRVDGLIPSEAGTLVVAQRKVGKTTFELNLARALLTGEDFLGRFGVRPVSGQVAFLNYEVSAAQLARWADEARVPRDRLFVVNLRGRRNPLGNDQDRELLAERLREQQTESLFVDPFGRAFTGKSQNDAGDVGAWLGDLDRWARGDVGATDVILSAHAGWDGERSRGSTALEDWADSVITLTRDDEDVRYLRAMGRDVEVDEDRLDFDAATRHLTLTGTGSRKATAKTRHLDELVPSVVAIVTATPYISGYKIGQALRETGLAFQKGDESKAAALAVGRGLLSSSPGPRNATYYSPPRPPQTSPAGKSTDLPDLPYRWGGQFGEVESNHLPAVTKLGLADLSGRCPSCEFHVQTQGHSDQCPQRQTP